MSTSSFLIGPLDRKLATRSLPEGEQKVTVSSKTPAAPMPSTPFSEGHVVKGGLNQTSQIVSRPPPPSPMRPSAPSQAPDVPPPAGGTRPA
jgi:hypothetical protein